MKRKHLTLSEVQSILNISYPTALRMVRDELEAHRPDDGATSRWLVNPDSVQLYIDKERLKIEEMQERFNNVGLENA